MHTVFSFLNFNVPHLFLAVAHQNQEGTTQVYLQKAAAWLVGWLLMRVWIKLPPHVHHRHQGGSMQINQYHSKDCKSALCSWKLKIKRDLESQDNALEMLLRGIISTPSSKPPKKLLKIKVLFELQMARFFSCRILRAPGNLHHTCPPSTYY